jgi:hypothetical protein
MRALSQDESKKDSNFMDKNKRGGTVEPKITELTLPILLLLDSIRFFDYHAALHQKHAGGE